ncbi:MAG: four helix bundle protein [bacterium]|nr:four helix bundle protein [bacterium]
MKTAAEPEPATFEHDSLDVYRLSLEFVRWTHEECASLSETHRISRDNLVRVSQSIPLYIAEGNAERSLSDRQRFFGTAKRSALACAAALDIIVACDALSSTAAQKGKDILHPVVMTLTRMTDSAGGIQEGTEEYADVDLELDYESAEEVEVHEEDE